MDNLNGKTALITGATGGIGRAVAETFVASGANVVLADLDQKALEALAAQLGEKAAIALCNVTSESDTDKAVQVALDRFGGLDIAVLNAGIEGKVAPIGEMALADFDQVMNVNVRGVFIGLSKVMPVMARAKGGSIVILSSTAGRQGSPGLSPYITSKHAVMGLMKSAAMEGAESNVRVNTVNPGPIDTRMMRQIELNASPDNPDAMKEALLVGIPMKRYGTAQEVAEIISFLSSDRASYCTGNYYGVDGGRTTG